MQLMTFNSLLMFDIVFVFFLFLVGVTCLVYYLPTGKQHAVNCKHCIDNYCHHKSLSHRRIDLQHQHYQIPHSQEQQKQNQSVLVTDPYHSYQHNYQSTKEKYSLYNKVRNYHRKIYHPQNYGEVVCNNKLQKVASQQACPCLIEDGRQHCKTTVLVPSKNESFRKKFFGPICHSADDSDDSEDVLDSAHEREISSTKEMVFVNETQKAFLPPYWCYVKSADGQESVGPIDDV